jgi:hypothetical protein
MLWLSSVNGESRGVLGAKLAATDGLTSDRRPSIAPRMSDTACSTPDSLWLRRTWDALSLGRGDDDLCWDILEAPRTWRGGMGYGWLPTGVGVNGDWSRVGCASSTVGWVC